MSKRLIKRKVEGTSPLETTYLYDGDKVISETTGTDITKYLYDTAGNLLIIVKNNINYYPVYDGLGSIIGIRDSAGNAINSYNYDEWGTVTSKTEGIQNPLRFASYRWDNDAQMYLLGARWYDSSIARFVSVDPYPGDQDDPITLNEYAYCRNNPINFTDPDGEFAQYSQLALAGGGTIRSLGASGSIAATPAIPIILGVAAVAGLMFLAYKAGQKIGTKINTNRARPNKPNKDCQTEFSETVQVPGYNSVRVEYHPQQGGTFHIQTKPNSGGNQYYKYINKPENFKKLPKAIKKNKAIQKAIKKGKSKGC